MGAGEEDYASEGDEDANEVGAVDDGAGAGEGGEGKDDGGMPNEHDGAARYEHELVDAEDHQQRPP